MLLQRCEALEAERARVLLKRCEARQHAEPNEQASPMEQLHAEIAQQLEQATAATVAALAQRREQIDGVGDERLKTLLTMRYINGWTWDKIAIEMHYERTSVFGLHRKALDAVARALKLQWGKGAPSPCTEVAQ